MAVFEHAPAGVALLDRDGRFLRVNPALARIVGRPPEELLMHCWQELIHPDDLQRAEAAVAAAMAGADQLEEIVRAPRPDGQEREVRVTARAVGGSPGNRAVLVAHYEDVTESRAHERGMRNMARRMAALVEAAPDAIVIRDGDGTIATWNPAAEAMFGRSADTVVGRRYEDVVIAEQDLERYRGMHARVLAGETLTVLLRARRADGTPFPAQVSAAPLMDAEGAMGTVAIICDITDLVAAEGELAAHAERLERSNSDLEAFAYAASHDLQEPLRSIALATDAVLRAAGDRLDDDERQLLAYVDEAATSMGDRVDALLQVARVRHGAAPDDAGAVEEAVEDALDGLRAAITEADADIDVRRPLPAVPLPRGELALVLQNLIANAIKYRRPGERPQVTVSGTEHDGYAELEVSDEGVGLAEADRDRIFQPFQRAESGVEGVGLGLAVVQRIAERRDGTVSVASEGPGRGARFTLRVPRDRPPGESG
jgi:PAS domain S-box-containing protein